MVELIYQSLLPLPKTIHKEFKSRISRIIVAHIINKHYEPQNNSICKYEKASQVNAAPIIVL